MEYTTLGRTGLKTSIAGLGCGGHSRLGIAKYGIDHAAGIVKIAYDLGINFFDTAHIYGTEPAVGKGLDGIKRDTFILSSKFPAFPNEAGSEYDFDETLNESLRLLKTDYIDIYHFHAVAASDYQKVTDNLLPKMIKAKESGKIRFIGITEAFSTDTAHEMLKKAQSDDAWDVMMIGYNILNPSAAKSVFPHILANNIGSLNMFAVRSALSNPEQLKIDIARILNAGQADPKLVSSEHTLDFLTENGIAETITDAAYRFCRHTRGIDVVLTGTSVASHLRQNVTSIQKPRLPEDVLHRLETMFGNVDIVSGE